MYECLGTIKYEFDTKQYVITLDLDERVKGYGLTIEEAIINLERQANKHNLWPERN